ncbi:MAG: hypothetical protein ABI398_13980 [Devosia sp.]
MVEQQHDEELAALHAQLVRLDRRAQRQRRAPNADWQSWSTTFDEALSLVDRIAKMPADGLDGLAIKIEAVVWFLDSTDAVLDVKGLRQLRGLAREARLMALDRRR